MRTKEYQLEGAQELHESVGKVSHFLNCVSKLKPHSRVKIGRARDL